MRTLPPSNQESRLATVAGCSAEPSAGPVATGPGLSKGHTVTNSSSKPSSSHLHFWDGAGLLQVKNPYLGDLITPSDKKKKKRGDIVGHSPKSQRRARMFLSKIPNEEIMKGLLVTLTYPGKQAADKIPAASEYLVYKDHLRKFNQAIVRKWEGSGAWFLEFQERGAPHYHLIVFGVGHSNLVPFQEWVSKEWNRIVDGGADHLEAGTRVEIPKHCQAARNYVTAYFTKGAQAPAETKVGRYWGKFGTSSIPLAPEVVETLTPQQAKIATRTANNSVANHIWNSGWKRLKARVGKKFPSVRFLTMVEFRALCENCRNGKHSKFVHGPGNRSIYASCFLEAIALSFSVPKVRFPRRYRRRNNSTVNLYCDASSFVESLKRHPRWDEKSPELTFGPIPSAKAALACFPDLIKKLKSAYLERDFSKSDAIVARLVDVCDSLGFEIEEGWDDATTTLFVLIRARSGRILFDHAF